MAQLWGLGGEIVRFVHTDEEYETVGPPDQFDEYVEFDEVTNSAIVQRLDVDWNPHQLINDQLYYKGALVTLNPPGESWLARRQAQSVQTAMRTYLAGLRQLPVQDASYAFLGRAFAIVDGADEGTILGITDKASAQAYITGKTEWANLTAATRAWEADALTAMAYVFMVVLQVFQA